MKVNVPQKTVTVCDLCKRETAVLDTCLICKKDYCLVCRSIMPGCMIEPQVCKGCDDRDEVKKVVAKYSTDFVRIYKLRNKALAKLSKQATNHAHP